VVTQAGLPSPLRGSACLVAPRPGSEAATPSSGSCEHLSNCRHLQTTHPAQNRILRSCALMSLLTDAGICDKVLPLLDGGKTKLL
jgi:hypothetical protein